MTGRGLASVWGPDNYGHFRPAKNLLFWLWAHGEGSWTTWRAALLGAFLVTVGLVQFLAYRVSGSRWIGIATAACWALNPTTASVTCWLSASNIGICQTGILLFLYFADRALDANPNDSRVRRFGPLALSVVSLSLALLSHELAVTAPFLLLVYRRLFARRTQPAAARLVFVASGICIALYVAASVAVTGPRTAYRSQSEPAFLLFTSAARYLGQNALLWIWPPGRLGVLLVDRPATHLVQSAAWWIALLAALGLLWRLRHRDPVLTFGLTWFLVLLAPVSNFVPLGNTPVAVHYLFLPGVGLAIAWTRSAALIAKRIGRVAPVAACATVAVCVAGTAFVWVPESRRVVAAWGDEERLFAMAASNYPDNVEALVNLCSIYLRRHQYEQATVVLDEARRLAPDEPLVVRDGFSLLWQTNQFKGALELLDRHPALAQLPDLQLGKGQALLNLQRFPEARDAFQQAFDSAKDGETRFAAGYDLVIALLQTGQHAEAEALVDRLLYDYPGRKELVLARDLMRQ